MSYECCRRVNIEGNSWADRVRGVPLHVSSVNNVSPVNCASVPTMSVPSEGTTHLRQSTEATHHQHADTAPGMLLHNALAPHVQHFTA